MLGKVTLSSGAEAEYYVDARRALLRPGAFRAVGELIAGAGHEAGAVAVGGPTMGAIPLACAAISAPAGTTSSASSSAAPARSTGCSAGSRGRSTRARRVLVVEDTVTSGGSTVTAIERIPTEGLEIAAHGLRRRSAGGRRRGDRGGLGRPVRALLTIDEIYPERPDRG